MAQAARALSSRIDLITPSSDVAPQVWNDLAGNHLFLRYEFLNALQETRCVEDSSGWRSQFLALRENESVVGAMPLYRKTNSYGEYVFDWAWADAYHHHGLRYYPKLVSAIPFTPATGPRLLAATPRRRQQLLRAAIDLVAEQNVSSLHVLFPNEDQARELETEGFMLRRGIQFHWRNENYESFDHFLSLLNRDKRKKIRQERRRAKDAGIAFRRLSGREARREDWTFFNRCYRNTYREHASTPYLNFEFFTRLGQGLTDNILLVMAEKDRQPIAAALNLHDDTTLYGRYWGALQHLPALHFETCYYQAIEFCIERGIKSFEGGAQGEHKLARGFLPVRTWSAHWIADRHFAAAIGEFLDEEARFIEHRLEELACHSPFKSEQAES
ncbi:MAG: GNAT family N-acetyltransferase [Burkholderiales bacterium]